MMLLNPFRFGGGGGGGGGDPSFASVSALLHFEAADDSTSFTDSSSNAITISALSGAKHATEQFKFGAASGEFNGSYNASSGQSALTFPSSSLFDFGSGNFTIETFVRVSNLTTVGNIAHGIMSKRATTAVFAPFNLELANNGGGTRLKGQVSTSGAAWVTCQSTTNLSTATWYHIALCRDGSSLRMFLDGVQQDTTKTVSGALMTNTAAVSVGAASVARDYGLSGFLDEIRITKGVARYVSNFTPPTAAFPNSA